MHNTFGMTLREQEQEEAAASIKKHDLNNPRPSSWGEGKENMEENERREFLESINSRLVRYALGMTPREMERLEDEAIMKKYAPESSKNE